MFVPSAHGVLQSLQPELGEPRTIITEPLGFYLTLSAKPPLAFDLGRQPRRRFIAIVTLVLGLDENNSVLSGKERVNVLVGKG